MAATVVKTVLQNLSSPIQKELGLLLGYNQELERLSSTLTAINATLEDAEEKQFSNRGIKDWLQKLKDAAYELDDILEESAYHDLQLEYEEVNCALPDCGLSDMIRGSCLSSFHPKHAFFRYQIAKRMKMTRERLDQIADERTKFHLTAMVQERPTGVVDWRQTISIISEPQVCGREEDRDKIVDFLVGDASHFEDLSVYPIVGLGGLGKTTLAQLIFNHERVVNHFELRIWVCVSEDFSLKRMTKAIIETASGGESGDMNMETLQKKLQDLLRQKKYLLVLDDVWDDGQDNWQRLKSVLVCGAKGASILVTTRLPKVATIMGTMPPLELSKLSDNDCWEVFKQRAFGPNEGERAELEIIGKEIVKKCGGVPLAAKALGSLLRFKKEKEQWLFVRDSKLLDLPQDENSVMPSLRLSYLNLPVELRRCFAFCALFPKDKTIDKQFLVELWMANGIISSDQMLDAEIVGDNVVNELYWRSFFEDVLKDGFGKITSFKLHDLFHDLAESVAEEVCCITNDKDVAPLSKRIRHLSICSETKRSFVKVNVLKTYIMQDDITELPPHVIKCYSLQVLKINGLHELPTALGRLKYLSYLDISYGDFRTLPESLCGLLNLQVLKLDKCRCLEKLPDNLINLKSLQHLSLNSCTSLLSLPPQIGKLTSLKNLSMYIVGKEVGFLLAEMGQLNLKGELRISHLERVESVMDAKEANMWSKHLNKLWLSWDEDEASELQENVEQILEMLQPHSEQLLTLGVEGYLGTLFPQWMSSPSLTKLNSLTLSDCQRCLHLPQMGNLPSLKKLEIYWMYQLQYLDNESYDGKVAKGFIALEFLELGGLPNLIKLSREDGANMFPRLSRLEIHKCPELLDLPCLPSLIDLLIVGNSRQDLLSSIHKLHALEFLTLRRNSQLTCFPDGMLRNLTSLKSLTIGEFSKLEVLQTEIIYPNAMQILHISSCSNLKSLTEQVLKGLQSLKILRIRWLSNFKLSTGFQYLTCLEDLDIRSCSALDSLQLHQALPHMTSLKSLTLSYVPDLESLPDCFGNLPLLHEVTISDCHKLRCLPTSFQYLSKLQTLEIRRCIELQKRCEKETGEDWPKIAHVPRIITTDY